MKFRLTYQGPLMSNSAGAKHKHEIRRVFHQQLKEYWALHPWLKDGEMMNEYGQKMEGKNLLEHRKSQYQYFGYNFVPLVTAKSKLICSINVLYLCHGEPGSLIVSGDLDNKIKTIFDALKMPATKEELGGYDTPEDGEDPFFCLHECDKLTTHISVETDLLLKDTGQHRNKHDSRLLITVQLQPYTLSWENINYLG